MPDPEFNAIRITPRKKTAAGIPSILASMRHSWGEMGLSRATRLLSQVNQAGGFDCMSCAWPDPDGERSVVQFCENGVKAVAEEATTKRLTPEFFERWSVPNLSAESEMWLGKQGRLTHPMVLRRGGEHYEPISWQDAFAMIAAELNSLDSPDEAVFYTSGRCSNEAAFLYQLFVRQYGTNNLPDCSNMCHESSGAALTPVIGVGKGTVTIDDFELADAIFIIGQNPGTNHPRMLTSLEAAKRNGCKIVSINPLPEAGLMRFKNPQELSGILGQGTQLTDLFLQVRTGGDAALLKGIIKEMLEAEERRPDEVLDRTFIEERTSGFGEFAAALGRVGWGEIIEESGISRPQIKEAARIMMESNRTISCWAMGLTQNKNAVATIQEIVNVHLLRGQIGKPGAGLCPVRGHSNVQGDRTVGVSSRPPEAFLSLLEREFGFAPPRDPGYDTVESIKAMHAGKAKVLVGMGGNLLSAGPDTEYTAEAFGRCRLTVQVSTKLNRSHLVTGNQALILPCLGRTEIDMQSSGPQFVSTENSMGVVQSSRGSLAPVSEHLKSEASIVAGLARATLADRSGVDWEGLVADYDLIRELIEKTVPGFEDYNQRVRQPRGFYLPNPAREGRFTTDSGRAKFSVNPIDHQHLEPGQFVLMTVRSHDQYNTTIYGLEDRYRGIHHGRRVVLMNPKDISDEGLGERQVVHLRSHFNGEERVARNFLVVPYDIPRRCAASYFPEANVLVPIGSVADKSNTPTSKYIVITIEPADQLANP
jgi:molybdopterin-dependent oxidoreductase alpha subunit